MTLSGDYVAKHVALGDASTTGDSWLLVLHAGDESVIVTLPGFKYGERFVPALDAGLPRAPLPSCETVVMFLLVCLEAARCKSGSRFSQR